MYGWDIVRTRPVKRTYGRALPAFIRNGNHYLATVDVYADGSVNCWGFVDLALFRQKLATRWVVTQPPVGACISIHNLGDATVADADWLLSPEGLLRLVA